MISSLKGERTPVAGDGTNDAPFPCLNKAELRSEIYRYFCFDLILYIPSTIFQLCRDGLPGLNQY